MRTVPFKTVYDAVVRLHGMSPRVVRDLDIAEAIVMHINSRVEQALLAWPWPEWNITEERAFREIWRNDKQYFRTNTDGTADEVYYLTNGLYYRVLGASDVDPPIGTLPTNTNFFSQITDIDVYIAYDQPCRRAIGQVLGVYSTDPRTVNSCCNGPWMLSYHPSEKGMQVRGNGNSTVFVLYQMPIPTYTMMPHIPGRTHQRGDVVLDIDTLDCFQAIMTTTDSPTSFPSAYRRIPFLQKWYDFVRYGAFADSLGEVDQGTSIDPTVRLTLASQSESKAMTALQRNIDSLQMQGQLLRWNFKKQRYWCESIPWNGGSVTTLSGDCQDDIGFIPPAPVDQASVTDEYHPQIDGITTGLVPLITIPTTKRKIGTMAKIVIVPQNSTNPEFQRWILRTGGAQIGNPGNAAPNDFDAINNNKFWLRVE